MINLTTARLIWLLYTSDCWGGGWSRAGPHRAGDLAGPSAGQEPATPLCPGTHPVPLSSLLCLLALMLSFPILRTLPLAPRVPSCQSPTPAPVKPSRGLPLPPPLLTRPAAFSCLALALRASLPPSLLLLCVPSLVLKEFVGVPPTPPPPALLLKIWQENNQGATKSGESWAGVCAPSLGLSLSDGS